MINKPISALFVTYDGLLDPLGGSQILPYLRSISRHPRRLHIVSFEKSYRFVAEAKNLSNQLASEGITWTPLSFTDRFGKLGKLWDLSRMLITCLLLQLRHKFGVIHCRSYQAMQTGCLLNRLTGAHTIFDMRGLWVDDRIEGGLWPQDFLVNRFLYKIYKRIERHLLECANHVVVLTDRVVPEIKKLAPKMKAPVTVIPCCADFDHFVRFTDVDRFKLRIDQGIPPSALLLSYLGSLGTLYLLEDMLRFFALSVRKRDDVYFLIITQDWREEHESIVRDLGLGHLREKILVRSANRNQVPALLGISDIMLSFRKPTYSQMACSPTKLAEAFALGIPVISNAGVGDVDQITQQLDAGAILDLSNNVAIDKAVQELDLVYSKGGQSLRDRSRPRLGLEVAELAYFDVYQKIEGIQCPTLQTQTYI